MSQPDDDRVSRNGSPSGWQADCAEIPVCAVLSCTPIQRRTGSFLRRKLLGFTRGYLLRNPDAHQAQGPPVDTQEMGNPDTACITYKLSKAVYRPLFELVWGKGSFDISFPANTADICATPGGAAVFGGSATPVHLSAADRTKSHNDYDQWPQSIDA